MMPDDPDAPRDSLVGRIARTARAQAMPEVRRAVAIGVAALLAAGPLITLGGAWAIAGRVRAETAAIASTNARRIAAVRTRGEARAELAPMLARAGVGATLEGFARALPADASVTRAARGSDGRLTIEVSTADPDRLRAALRRDDATQGLRDAGQRQGDGAMLVTLEEAR